MRANCVCSKRTYTPWVWNREVWIAVAFSQGFDTEFPPLLCRTQMFEEYIIISNLQACSRFPITSWWDETYEFGRTGVNAKVSEKSSLRSHFGWTPLPFYAFGRTVDINQVSTCSWLTQCTGRTGRSGSSGVPSRNILCVQNEHCLVHSALVRNA